VAFSGSRVPQVGHNSEVVDCVCSVIGSASPFAGKSPVQPENIVPGYINNTLLVLIALGRGDYTRLALTR
jgi:hypothetical protein